MKIQEIRDELIQQHKVKLSYLTKNFTTLEALKLMLREKRRIQEKPVVNTLRMKLMKFQEMMTVDLKQCNHILSKILIFIACDDCIMLQVF